MKKFIILVCIAITVISNCYSQDSSKDTTDSSKTTSKTVSKEKESVNNRISFVVGIGGSYVFNNLYQNPTVNKSTSIVNLERAQNFKSDLQFGIVYTPIIWRIISSSNDTIYTPKGISFSTFINPIALTKATNTQSFFNVVDFGFGIGYKTVGGFIGMVTLEVFSVRQPKDWFINDFKNNDKSYIINNSNQQSFDINDNSIFRDKSVFTIGLKFCYTFDIIKDYSDKKNNLKLN